MLIMYPYYICKSFYYINIASNKPKAPHVWRLRLFEALKMRTLNSHFYCPINIANIACKTFKYKPALYNQMVMSFNEFIAEVLEYNPKADRELIRKAFEFAESAHKEHKRESGEPYFIH